MVLTPSENSCSLPLGPPLFWGIMHTVYHCPRILENPKTSSNILHVALGLGKYICEDSELEQFWNIQDTQTDMVTY
jgi:hypothetical protein